MLYTVFGDYGYTSETVLFESNDRKAAVEWAKNYVKAGDTGSYDVMDAAYFAEDGEYITLFTYRCEQDDESLVDEW